MILFKCTKAFGMEEMAEESMKKADEIYAKEENDSHRKLIVINDEFLSSYKMFVLDSTCSITSCSICSNTDSDSGDDASSQSSEIQESVHPPPSLDSNEFRQENNGSPVRRLKKSFSADILNHPPLPRFPRYNVKRNQRSSAETTSSASYIPPLPLVQANVRNFSDDAQITKPEKSAMDMKNKNASMSNLTSELTFQNLSKFNYSSMDEFNNNPSFNAASYQNIQSSVIDIVPKPSKALPDLDQTIGIPLTFDAVDNTGNAFYPSLGPQYSTVSHASNNNDVSNDYEYHQVPTTIHQYPLISGTIPSTTQAKINYSTMPAPTMNPIKKDSSAGPTGSILSSAGNNTNTFGGKKENGEKNKVKFSDTVTVAVVMPDAPRKEKNVNFNERIKRKTVYPGMMDPRRE